MLSCQCGICCKHTLLMVASRDEDEPSTIIDPDATKPDGWLDDEPRLVPDPEAVKPEDWWVLHLAPR